jgi:hypothetical protein
MDITLVCIGKTRSVAGTIGRQVEKKGGECEGGAKKRRKNTHPVLLLIESVLTYSCDMLKKKTGPPFKVRKS